ncbi:MAG: discoidin domain-containing protein [Planctomycetota bacterium]|jgi:hypothetical protein
MYKRLSFIIVLSIALSLACNTAKADLLDGLVVLHDFDDLVDGGDNGLDLILEGDAMIADGMLWLDGDGDWADVGSLESFSAVNPLVNDVGEPSDYTLAIAYATESDGEWGALVSIGPDAGSGSGDLSVFSRAGGPELDHWWVDAAGGDSGDNWIDGNVHLAIITYTAEEGLYEFYAVEDGEVTLYGEMGGFDYSEAWNPDLDYGARLGYFRNELVAAEEVDWEGWIECQIDYFAMWNRVLDIEEMPEVVDFGAGPPSGKAGSPEPGDGDDFVDREPELSWNPGTNAVTHNVYFDTNFDDVNDADTDSPLLVSLGQIGTTYTPTEILDWGQEYFWRIDEVNDTEPNSPWKGTTWSFTVEPYNYILDPEEDQYGEVTASSSEEESWPDATIWDGFDGDEHSTEAWAMWISSPDDMSGEAWIQFPFDTAYQLQEIQIWNYNEDIEPILGFGFNETVIEYSTNDPEAEEKTWVELMTVNLTQAPGEPTEPTDTLDLQGTVATALRLTAKSNHSGFNDQFGLSGVRIHYLPIRARDPVPEPEEVVDLEDLVLEWLAGREATSHKIYLGTDEEDLALVDTTSETSYSPEGLALSQEYFWRVDEIDDPLLAGNVWSFSIKDHLVVDDMESYEDSIDEASIAIWGTWADGLEDSANGSLVSYDFGETEREITHDDSDQSMPLSYDNTGDAVISETTRTFDEPQLWTRFDVKALTLYIHGSEDNVGGQMYIKINDTEKDITVELTDESWQEVNIDLADFTGVNLESVTSLTIGIKGAGSSGTVYIDNIRLYPSRCIAALSPEGDINGDCIVDEEDLAIIADNWLSTPMQLEYTFDSDLSDTSGNGFNGVNVNNPVVQDGILTLDGTNFVDIPLGADNPFDGTSDYSLALDFQTEVAGTLFSSARDDNGDNHALAMFIANGENAEEGAIVLDHFWIGLAEAGAEAYDGEWHTAVVTYSADDQTIVVYLDGEAGEPWEVEVDLPIIPNIEEDTVRIGSSRNPNYPFGLPDASDPEFVTDGNFIGNIDNLRIFNFALIDIAAAELPDSIPTHPADLNGDGIVDQADKDIVEANLGTESVWP